MARPCRSVKVRTRRAAILVQITGVTFNSEGMLQEGDVKTRKMHELRRLRVYQQRFEIGAIRHSFHPAGAV